jgi:hypothetical protein
VVRVGRILQRRRIEMEEVAIDERRDRASLH